MVIVGVVVLPLMSFMACAQVAAPVAPVVPVAPIYGYNDSAHSEKSSLGMVAAQNRLSASVGAQILADGGNAFDAAVAVGFSLAVTLPRAGNIGGGGFMLIHDAASGENVAIAASTALPPAARISAPEEAER